MPPFKPGQLLRRYSEHFAEPEYFSQKFARHWERYTRWFMTWGKKPVGKSGDVEMTSPETDPSNHVDPRADLYAIIASEDEPDSVQSQCWTWYLDFLETLIKELWASILYPVIFELPHQSKHASQEDWARVYQVLVVIAGMIKNDTSGASVDLIVEELRSAKLLNPPCEDYPDQERQMVWCLASPLTMLFDARKPYQPRDQVQLRLRRPASNFVARGRHRGTVVTSFEQPVTAAAESAFFQMLGLFGTLLPEVRQISFADSGSRLVPRGGDGHLFPAYVFWHGLKEIAQLKIEWVNTINEHLQLDERKRILRVYRFPAFCRLLYATGDISGHATFLSQVFGDYKASTVQGQPQDRDSLTFFDFLRDMLLSYRLLFGIDGRSRKAFKKELKDWTHDKRHDGPMAQRIYQIDPLLLLLCTDSGKSPELRALLQLIDGEETSPRFAFADFPFLGNRLAALQSFGQAHKATGFRSLWSDRRDTPHWWVFWAAITVLLLATGAFVLQFWQLVFQILQTFWQSNLTLGN